MKMLLAAFVFNSLIASPAWAASRTVTLSVPDMYCAACPITVKKALSSVNGVSKIAVGVVRSRQPAADRPDNQSDVSMKTTAQESRARLTGLDTDKTAARPDNPPELTQALQKGITVSVKIAGRK